LINGKRAPHLLLGRRGVLCDLDIIESFYMDEIFDT
jgi:hypothetical protein